jgi:hypothetical protein
MRPAQCVLNISLLSQQRLVRGGDFWLDAKTLFCRGYICLREWSMRDAREREASICVSLIRSAQRPQSLPG